VFAVSFSSSAPHFTPVQEVDLRVSICFLLVPWGGGETEFPWYVGHYWPTVPAPGERWWWAWSSRWGDNWQGNWNTRRKPPPSATLSNTNATWPDLGSNPGHRSGRPATEVWSSVLWRLVVGRQSDISEKLIASIFSTGNEQKLALNSDYSFT
jgi:hypothetical protein